MMQSEIAQRYEAIQEQVAEACKRSGREPSEVTIIGVSKTKSFDLIRKGIASGISDFGESYVQELVEKEQELSRREDNLRWHYIGHLQRNKVKYIAPFVHLIHGIDSERLADEVNKQGGKDRA